jgi:deoxycytidylate deaminase
MVAVTKDEKYIRHFAKLAESSKPVRRARMVAGLVYKNDIVATGTAQLKTHPFQSKFGKNEAAIYLHAEIDCIKNALKVTSKIDIAKSTLYVARRKFLHTDRKFFENGLACPCSGCCSAIVAFDIPRTVFTLDGTGYQVL